MFVKNRYIGCETREICIIVSCKNEGQSILDIERKDSHAKKSSIYRLANQNTLQH